jgi:hypothetical protein
MALVTDRPNCRDRLRRSCERYASSSRLSTRDVAVDT